MPDAQAAWTHPWRVRVLNPIAQEGLQRLPPGTYLTGPDVADPDALLLRSADLHGADIPPSVQAVARAGAGTNNIPVAALSARGVPVFNTPGANANAVKELVLAGMLMAARNLVPALRFVQQLDAAAPDLAQQVEAGKKGFTGQELRGETLGLIGLGRVGSLVAQAAIDLGMEVLGHDPDITVDAAWSLPSRVRRADSVQEVIRASRFISLHVPLLEATRGLVDAKALAQVQPGAVLLNFSREGVVDDVEALRALDGDILSWYVTDFPGAGLHGHPRVLALPHLGASTRQAERQCAVMAVDLLRDFLEHGNVRHSVNFPEVVLARDTRFRVAIANANVPSMLGQISTAMAGAGLNIDNMVNKSRGEVAYTLLDLDSAVDDEVIAQLRAIEGVLSVRYLPVL